MTNNIGYAKFSDLKENSFTETLDFLDKDQIVFNKFGESFRSKGYMWPIDALNNWSRIWEYPFVYNEIIRKSAGRKVKLLDVGSGVTFFPYSLTKMGHDVTCTDIDYICEIDYQKANQTLVDVCKSVDFKLITGANLPFDDNSFDMVYCISVLEHIPDWMNTLSEMHRVLAIGGNLILTIDIDISNKDQINVHNFDQLNKVLTNLGYQMNMEPVHLFDVLTSRNSTVPMRRKSGLGYLFHYVKQKLIKPLLGRKPSLIQPPHLAVFYYSLTKVK
jgi:2-polyprenyl-3-methyl-5-hydroxy-6-metoxy-1,4-benzoquinol methylase